MRFSESIDLYLAEMRQQGRINSPRSEVSYRATLVAHADDVDNRDPSLTGREDVKRTLRRWSHPNTQAKRRSQLISFYRWMVQEGMRPYNPAEQTRAPKMRKPEVYRLTRAEAVRMLNACRTRRERWAIHVGMLAGLRRKELLGLQGRHFQRRDESGDLVTAIWVSPDIGKGGRGREVPVLPELAPVVAEIREQLEPDDFVLPAQRWRDPGVNRDRVDLRKRPSSEQALWHLVRDVGKRAGITTPIGPHTLRHGFGDHVAKYAGIENARALMGHADIGTTKTYVGEPSLDELMQVVAGFRFATGELSLQKDPTNPAEAPTGIEPVPGAPRAVEPNLEKLLAGLEPQIRRYAELFGAL